MSGTSLETPDQLAAAPHPARVSPAPDVAAATRARVRMLGAALAALLVSRGAAEIVNTFAWSGMNYVWSGAALLAIGLWLWPLLLSIGRGEGNLFVEYGPIFVYLAWLVARVQPGDLNSVKCVLSECINWSCFVFAVEACSRDRALGGTLRRHILRIVKLAVLVGLGQLALHVVRSGDWHPLGVIDARSVSGIFVHPNVFLVLILPFSFYLLKRRAWGWSAATLAACVGTGTRSPFFAAACLTPLIACSLLRRPLTWKHLVLTLLLTGAAYTVLIRANCGADTPMEDVDSRATGGTLQWRIAHWQYYLDETLQRTFWIGHGTGTADNALMKFGDNSLPHNDYVRLFYDLGAVGMACYAGMIAFLLWLMMRSLDVENDFVLVGYLLIVCFCITDNFVYFTMAIWNYVFFGSYLARPGERPCGSSK